MRFEDVFVALEQARRLGFRQTSLGAKLFGHVPHVAPEAWLHSVYFGLSSEEIRHLEDALGRTIPNEVEEFLRISNGLNLFSNSLFIFGLRRSNERVGDAAWQPFSIEAANTLERPSELDSDAVVVGGYFDDGSRLVVSSRTSKVTRIPKGRAGPVLTTWDGFEQMLTSEVQRLSSLFDDRGRMLDEDVPTTPP